MAKQGASKFGEVALIDETRCIGCARCLEACPVDAIVGAPNLMHTVMAFECIGCQLCLAPCPVDCIQMIPTPEGIRPQTPVAVRQRTRLTRFRYRFRQQRLEQQARDRQARLAAKKAALARGQRNGSNE